MPKRTISKTEIFLMIVLLLLALFSLTILNDILSSPQFHSHTISLLEDQKDDALTLSVAVTAASTALSALPDDVASPIANQLPDFSLPLFIIVSTIYLEIFLLTTLGWLSCTFLIPAACVLGIFFILYRKHFLIDWIKKLLILALALILLIPVSTAITSQIEDTYSETVNQKLHAASHIASIADAEDEKDANAILSFFSDLADNVTSLIDAARNMLSTLVDAIALLLITSCIIPLITLLVFLLVIKAALKIEIPVDHFPILHSKKRT